MGKRGTQAILSTIKVKTKNKYTSGQLLILKINYQFFLKKPYISDFILKKSSFNSSSFLSYTGFRVLVYIVRLSFVRILNPR